MYSFKSRAPLVRTAAFAIIAICCLARGEAPANDFFTNAIPLYGNSVTFTGTLANATYEFEAFEDLCACNALCMAGGSVWWTWTATNSTGVVIALVNQGDGNEGGFSAYMGSSVGGLTT